MKKLKLTLFLTLFILTNFAQTTYYVSTTGTINATGTSADPYSMEYLEQANNHAGDTFLVKNGEYHKNWKFQVFGTANNPVKIKAQNWRQAKIVGGTNKYDNKRSVVKISGAYCWVMDFEIYDNNQKRIWINWSDDILMSTGCEIYADGSKFINNDIHDLIEGIESWSVAHGAATKANASEAHFNLIYNIGIDFSDDPRPQSGHGHAIYAQNDVNNIQPKYFTGNSIWGNFGEGIHIYTEGGNIESMVISDNSVFNMIGYAIDKIKSRATIIGSLSKTFTGLVYDKNIIYREAVSIGYGTPWQKNVKVSDNAFYTTTGITMKRFYGVGTEVKRNTFATENGTLFLYSLSVNADLDLLNLQDNFMYNTSAQWGTTIGVQPPSGGTTALAPANWGVNATGNSINTTAPPLNIRVITNDYDANFAKVTIVNYAATNSVTVNTLPFNNGDLLEIYDTQNMSAAPTSITYNGVSYDFPMNNTAFSALFQNDVDVSHASHTDNRFAEFLVRMVSGGSQPTPDQIIAKNDNGASVTEGIVTQIVANIFTDNGNGTDVVNGVNASLSNINLTLVSTTDAGITLELATGVVNASATVPVGNHTLVYKICQKTNVTNCDNGTVSFVVTASAPQSQSVSSFTLYDGGGNIVSGFESIQSGSTINLQSVPSALNIRANTTPSVVGSVYFQLDAAFKGENVAPYDWFGNGSGTFSVGAHTITATPYTLSGQGGAIGTPLSINFNVIDGSVNPIQAVNDQFTATTAGGNIGDLTTNDLFNGVVADDNLITATLINDGGTGSVIKAGYTLEVPNTISVGTYNLTYKICEDANPSNCSTASIVLSINTPTAGKAAKGTFTSTFTLYKNNTTGVYSIEFPIDTEVKNIFIHTSDGQSVMFKNYTNANDKKVYNLTSINAGSYYIVVYMNDEYIGKYITVD